MKEVFDDLKKGKMIILVDDEHRENEGDLVVSAEKITPEHISFMANMGRGLICLSLTDKDLDRLNILQMRTSNQSCFGTAFTESIEASSGVTTGSSAYDRAHTIKTACNLKSKPQDIAKPGHVFPLHAKSGGVFVRQGHTEGGVDLMRLAGLRPQAVICEIMKTDGNMARLPDLKKIAKKYDLKIVSISQILRYRAEHDPIMTESARTNLPTNFGDFEVRVFRQPPCKKEHVVFVSRKKSKKLPLVRIHSECLTGDIFGSLRCDCGWQLRQSLEKINQEGGLLIYMPQEGRGIGLTHKIQAYALQEKKHIDTIEANHLLGFQADERNYIDAAQILHKLKIKKIKLLTNNPQKIKDLTDCGIEVIERIPLISPTNLHNKKYLKTKQQKLGHLLENV